MKKATLYTDGGARGNPGPAGIGYVLSIDGASPIEGNEYIGETTNNQAEYQALVAGLKRAQEEQITNLACFLDSELVVKQLAGEYRVKDANIKPVHATVRELVELFETVTFTHIPRGKNKEADRLVNKAIDKST